MSDRLDDQRIGVKSSALFFGDQTPNAVGIFFPWYYYTVSGGGYFFKIKYIFLDQLIHCQSWLVLAGAKIKGS